MWESWREDWNLSKLILCGGPVLHHRLLVLLEVIWTAGVVVRDWKDAKIIPISKKGDIRDCNNWRGISLLDAVGKLFGCILQDTKLPATLSTACLVIANNAASSANFDSVITTSSSLAVAVLSPTNFLLILYFTVTPALGQ